MSRFSFRVDLCRECCPAADLFAREVGDLRNLFLTQIRATGWLGLPDLSGAEP
jgi:hypothetical protein